MELPLLLQLYAWHCYGFLAIGLALNFLLLFVAKKCVSSGLREYRRVVFYFSVPNICMLILQAINQPLVFSDDNRFNYILLNGPIVGIHFPILWTIVFIFYMIFFNLIMVGLAMQFIERIVKVLFCATLSLASIPSLIIITFFLTTTLLAIPERREANLSELNKPLFAGAEDATINIKIAAKYDPEDTISRSIFNLAFIFLIFAYLATIFCYRRIKAFLKANMQTDVVRGVNRKTLNNIIRSMLIQAFVPIFPLLITASIIGFCVIAHFGTSLDQGYLLFFGPMNWLPVLNPLVTILTIDDYRRGIFGIFKRQPQSQTPTVPFVKPQET